MKFKKASRILAVVLSLMLIASCIPLQASAETTEEALSMVEGEVIKDFANPGTECVSSDPSIAWVDKNGSLNALKCGTVTITDPDGGEKTITVTDYSDGSAVVGNLKLLARFNDSMQFYDGHVYLLFTSYQDGVTISVPDLYAAYDIDDVYYKDINEDISNGSNHTGNDAEKYFKFSDTTKSVTLDRGEIVTIGMYRDFDLSVPQAALGSIKNSSGWTKLKNAGKAAVIEALFKFLDEGKISTDEAMAKVKAAFEEVGLDYNKALDGVVSGGVCFNRELYNQKLEWDQYENVTYDLDITRNQLNTMSMYLGGNLNKFSILKNSCATVALRAWNASVGTRNGEDTAYKLTSAGDGIYSLVDAPKGVRDNIRDRLPGYYLNNAQGVAEPDAGFTDDTGSVYVSAPKKVSPVEYVYANDSFVIDESRTKISDVFKAAKGDKEINYSKDEQQVNVSINVSGGGSGGNIRGIVSDIAFDINGETIKADGQTAFEDGIWFKVKADVITGGNYYVTNGSQTLPSVYEDGYVCFKTNSLPFNFVISSSVDEAKNILNTVIYNGDDLNESTVTEVYFYNGGEKVVLDSTGEVAAGTKFFVKSAIGKTEYNYILTDILLNNESIFDDEHFDTEEGAYFATMPAQYSDLTIKYEKAVMTAAEKFEVQIGVGDIINASDYGTLTVNDVPAADRIIWQVMYDENDVVEVDGDKLTALKEGEAVVWACSESNENIGVLYEINVYGNADDMVKFTFDDSSDDTLFTYCNSEGNTELIPYSGFLVKKGTDVGIVFNPNEAKAVLLMLVNNKYADYRESLTIEQDTNVKVVYADAEMTGMPNEIRLDTKDDTYQLNAKTKYKGLLSFIDPYDMSIEYVSSDPLVNVDENGLISVTGDIPADGKMVIVTARAGSCNGKVTAATRVVLGDYTGAKTVGKIVISARRISNGELVPHGSLTFTTYEDLDLGISYYKYLRPDDRYNDLMLGYLKEPEKFTSDPAVCNNNDLGLENRESYFTLDSNGAGSDTETISLVAGESVTLSNYSFDSTNIYTIKRTLEGSLINNSKDTQELVRQMELYLSNSEDFDSVQTFDSLTETLKQIIVYTQMTGYNPADGPSDGGMCVNIELYNQFRRNDSQTPNNYYEVEITADELELLKAYLADPANNYYSLFTKNCATGAVDIWNTTIADRPELKLKGNYSGISVDPESLYFELGMLRNKQNLDGKGGVDFIPHTIRYTDEIRDVIEKIKNIGKVELTDECKDKIDAAREAYEALTEGEKTRIWNYDALTDAESAYDTLKKARDDEELAKNIAEFEQYKAEQIMSAENMSEEDDNFMCGLVITIAKAAIASEAYDPEKSLEENKAAVDEIIASLQQALDMIRNPQPEPQPEPVLIGDVNCDGVVDIFDSLLVQKYTADKAELTDEQLYAADVNDDGRVDILDAMEIQKYTADKTTEFNKK